MSMLTHHRIAALGLAAMIGWLLPTAAWDSEPASNSEVSLSGWFNVVWGDPPPGSDEPPIIEYSLTDNESHRTVLLFDEPLIQKLGGVRRFIGKRVKIVGEAVREPQGAVRVRSITVEPMKE